MDRVAVAGLSLHHTDVDGLERAKRGLAALEEPPAKALADRLGASEAVLISTCNRVELVFARENGHAPSAADRGAPPRGPAAFRRSCRTGRPASSPCVRR
jgi:glutamyl-tRNA reductase